MRIFLILATLCLALASPAKAQSQTQACGVLLAGYLRSLVNDPAPTDTTPYFIGFTDQGHVIQPNRVKVNKVIVGKGYIEANTAGDISMSFTCTDTKKSTCEALSTLGLDPVAISTDTAYPSWLRDDLTNEIAAGTC